MKVLQKIVTTAGEVLCVRLEAEDHLLNDLFSQARTSIWTHKYHEGTDETGREQDQYDRGEQSVRLAMVLQDDSLLGGCRLVFANNLSELPMGVGRDYTGSKECPKVVEISRFFISLDYQRFSKNDGGLLLEGLIQGIESVVHAGGLRHAYATIRSSLFQRLLLMGVPIQRIGTFHGHGGKKFIPSRISARG